MKRAVMLVMVLVVPLLYTEDADIAPSVLEQRTDTESSMLDMNYRPEMNYDRGRALGDILDTIDVLAFGCDGPSGLTWDGQYLYVMGLISDSIYKIDPTGPSLVAAWPSPPTSAFGIGKEQNLWATCITTDSIYEYTTAGVPTGNMFFGPVGAHIWVAGGTEWWPDGEMWFPNVGTSAGNKVYKYGVPSGTVLDSMTDPAYTYTSQRGMSYDPHNDKFWIGGWNSDSIWELNSDGTPSGRSFYMDGVAGIAYDWQTTMHPTPVLWVCLQTPDLIVMVDADNPNPGPGGVTFDFEDGWQGWIHTNGDTFPFAWDVQPSGLHATWTPPDAGDSCMWIDSDAAGVGPVVEDTAWSPVLVPNPTMDWLKYGLGYNNLTATSDSLYVGIMTYTSGAWNPPVQLIRYSADYGPAWDSLDVSSYSSAERIRIYFYYSGSYDWYAAFDNVTIDASLYGPGMVYFWDFEDGEQDWTHTNGGTFPAAWDVVSSSYTVGSYTIAPPDAGDSSFCIDGDSGGICHDTAMCPVVDNPGFSYFKWGMHFQNYVSYQTFTVIMRTYSSGAWNPWTDVWTYTSDTPARYDSVDISATVSDSVQVGFVYDQPNATYAWFAAFDNVELMPAAAHDVGCYAVVSPPEGATPAGNYDVIGWIRNTGGSDETFDVVAHVYDTVGMSLVFDQTINLSLTVGSDTNLDFGQVTFDPDSYYFTEIYTMLAGDADPSNDTSSVYSRTAIGLGDVIFELDAEGACSDNQLLGIEFDGERFYFTGGGNAADPNKVYVVDTTATLLYALDQPAHSTGWGWR
ncbi:MAG: hypothetical protein PVH23_04350, partial [candidate division WOR-3 bacterium]